MSLLSISATYNGGDVIVGTTLTNLTGITVTALYSDGSTSNVTDYTLSGAIIEGINTITVTYEEMTTTFEVTGIDESYEEVTELDLSTLTLDHIRVNDATGDNLSYDQETHKLTVDSTGWYKASYFTTPLKVGHEIELACNFCNTGTTGNHIALYTPEDLSNPTLMEYFPCTSAFGIYISGSSSNSISQWDYSAHQIVLSPEVKGDALVNDTKLVLKLTQNGVKVYINDTEYTVQYTNEFTTGKDYYLGFHMNASGSANYGATINYIGPIRE